MVMDMCSKESDYFGDMMIAERLRGKVTKRHELVRQQGSPDKMKLEKIEL